MNRPRHFAERLFIVSLIGLAGCLLYNILAYTPFRGVTATPERALTLGQRVTYQRAIEEVYWRHRTWPATEAGSKPMLDQVMPPAQIREKVEDYLRKSAMLEDYWQVPVTGRMLQEEIERMASHTMRADMLKELWAALDSDPLIIAECLARPILVERLYTEIAVKDYTTAQTGLRQAVWRGSDKPTSVMNLGWRPMAGYEYRLPAVAGQATCNVAGWTMTTTFGAPSTRYGHTAVWTGSEMIVWGGYSNGAYLNTGGRYDPATDIWTAVTTGDAPTGRRYHVAVWTGSEMVVWGGSNRSSIFLNTGARYNPMTDFWTPTSTAGEPGGRYAHTAVWTGREMIVWGGLVNSTLTNTGGRYDAYTDSWRDLSTPTALAGRRYHTAVWTGSEMIIWGGEGNTQLNTGGRYNPANDSWTLTSTAGAPVGRDSHTAVWTGSEMIVWGGSNTTSPYYMGTGGRYNPATNRWSQVTASGGPSARSDHTAIWTGDKMIVWGGVSSSGSLNTGGAYAPATDSWSPTATSSAPAARYFHTAVWTESEMIVWGVSGTAGGRYCAGAGGGSQCTYSISPTNAAFPPGGGSGRVSVSAPAECNWTATTSDEWITITQASGSGNGTVTYTVQPTADFATRRGTILIGNQVLTVKQKRR
jgi:N-acetylneuraminic acid mutarotase